MIVSAILGTKKSLPTGFPTFRKLYGKIRQPLTAGSNLRVNFVDNYHIPGVAKKLLFGNVSSFGGRNEFLAWFSLASGLGCFVLSFILRGAKFTQAKRVGGKKVLSWKP